MIAPHRHDVHKAHACGSHFVESVAPSQATVHDCRFGGRSQDHALAGGRSHAPRDVAPLPPARAAGLRPASRGLSPHGGYGGYMVFLSRQPAQPGFALPAEGFRPTAAAGLLPASQGLMVFQEIIPIGIEQAACARSSERITTPSQQSPIQNLQSKMV